MPEIHRHPSTNFNDRKLPISLIILHYTGMETGAAALERMCDPGAEVSAHYMVEESGRILQLVDDEKRAWHAGLSFWQGERDINSASIGIEIVNGGHDFGLPDYPDAQIRAVIVLVQALMRLHGLSADRVIGHSDIAPARKADPGEHFPWPVLAGAGCAVALTPRDGAVDPEAALAQIGYDPEVSMDDAVTAFQRRHRPSRIDGLLDGETRALLAAAMRAYPSAG